MSKVTNKIRKNSGQSIVEMALILPILVLIVFGGIDFGRVVNAYLVVTEATREGARQFAVEHDVDKAKAKMTSTATAASFDLTDFSPNVYENVPDIGSVTATADYTVEFITPGVYALFDNMILGKPLKVTSTTIMRME